jgi:HEPN domain-containing protein
LKNKNDKYEKKMLLILSGLKNHLIKSITNRIKKREEIIQELEKEKRIISLDKSVIENNLLNEKLEKQTLARYQKSFTKNIMCLMKNMNN